MKNYIFDFNGTLYQDTPIHLDTWRSFLGKYGYTFTDDTFYKYMCGPPDAAIIRRFFGQDLPDDRVKQLTDEKEGAYRQLIHDDPSLRSLTPGAAELLDLMRKLSIPHAIATGSDRENVDFYMDTLGVSRWFDYDHVFYAEGDLPGKPDPAIYRLAMRKLGYLPEDTVVVEDAMPGVQSAIGAGVKSVIAIDTTLGPEAFRGIPEVIGVIHDFHDFARFL